MVVLGHKEPELLIAYLGVIKSGRAYVPVDTAVPPQRIERIAAASGARSSCRRKWSPSSPADKSRPHHGA